MLLTELELEDNYVVEGHESVDHLKISILIDGKAAAHVNLFVYSLSDDSTELVHPWLAYKPAAATVFPTKLVYWSRYTSNLLN